jgi:hypothetical protein
VTPQSGDFVHLKPGAVGLEAFRALVGEQALMVVGVHPKMRGMVSVAGRAADGKLAEEWIRASELVPA